MEADGTLAPQPWEENEGETPDSSAEWQEPEIYESGEVGTSSGLYGEEVIAELGVPYEESWALIPN